MKTVPNDCAWCFLVQLRNCPCHVEMILSEKEETVEKAAEEARPEGEQSRVFAFPFGVLVLAWNVGKGSNWSKVGGWAAGCEAQEVHSQAVRQVAPQGAESSWTLSFVNIFVNCVQLGEENGFAGRR